MRWFRRSRTTAPMVEHPHTAEDDLWQSVGELFAEAGESHQGPDIGFQGLTGSDVRRVWEHVSARTTTVGSEPIIWDRDNESVPGPKPSLAEAVSLLAQGELGYIGVSLDGVRSRGVKLPWLYLELWPGAVSMYWWVDTDSWDADSATALAELQGEIRGLVPQAELSYEWADTGEFEFWEPVNRYLASKYTGR